MTWNRVDGLSFPRDGRDSLAVAQETSKRIWGDGPRLGRNVWSRHANTGHGAFRGHHVGQGYIAWGLLTKSSEESRPVGYIEPQTTWERIAPATRPPGDGPVAGSAGGASPEDLWGRDAERDRFFYQVHPNWPADLTPKRSHCRVVAWWQGADLHWHCVKHKADRPEYRQQAS